MGYIFYRYWKPTTSGAIFYDTDGQVVAQLTHSSGVTDLKGADGSGDKLKLHANQTNSFPRIELYGNSNTYYLVASTKEHRFYTGATIPVIITDYALHILESSSSPSAKATYGCLWPKDDDTLHYIDGGGVDHTIRYV